MLPVLTRSPTPLTNVIAYIGHLFQNQADMLMCVSFTVAIHLIKAIFIIG